MFQSCWNKIGILSVYRSINIGWFKWQQCQFDSGGSWSMLYCEVWTCLVWYLVIFDRVGNRIADKYSSHTLGAVCHGRSKVDGKNVHLCCLCLFSGWCPNVPYRNFSAICAINRIINAHNSEAIKDIFVICFATYLLQKVLSGWGALWGCCARGQLGRCGAGVSWGKVRGCQKQSEQCCTAVHCSLHGTALSQCSVSGARGNSTASAVCFRVEPG